MTATTDPVVLFDMDGVLLTGRGSDPAVHVRAMEDVATAWDLEVPAALREPLGRYPYTAALETACETLGVDPTRFFDARERRSAARIAERITAGSRPLYDDVTAVEALSADATLGVVSNNYDPAVRTAMDHHGLDVFAVARGRDIGLDGFRRRKPDPHYLQEALRTLGVTAGLYVGDRQTDVEAAQAAGLSAVYLRRAHNRDRSLRITPEWTIDSLTELHHIVGSRL